MSNPSTPLGRIARASLRTASYMAGAVKSTPAALAFLGSGALEAGYAAGHLTRAGAYATTGAAMVHVAALARAATKKAQLIGIDMSAPAAGQKPPVGTLAKAKSMAGFGARVAIEAYPLISALANIANSKPPTMTALDNSVLNPTGLPFADALALSGHLHAMEAREAMIDFKQRRLGFPKQAPIQGGQNAVADAPARKPRAT